MASVRTEIRDVLDTDLPADPYPPKLFDAKVQAVFDHVVTAYGDDQTSVYQSATPPTPGLAAVAASPDLAAIAEDVVERTSVDAEFASLVAEQLGMAGGMALRTVSQLIDNDEDFAVEFRSTARWDLRENQPNKARTPS